MTEIETIKSIASELIEQELETHFLFTHTRDIDEYRKVKMALGILSKYTPVMWTGKTGSRHTVEA